MRVLLLLFLSGFVLQNQTYAQSQPDAPDDSTHAALRRAMGEGTALSEATASDQIPKGEIRVRVIRESGLPIENAVVRLGIRSQTNTQQQGEGQAVYAKTNQAGIAIFTGLSVGESQAYRARVHYQGAKYTTPPFRLEENRGVDAYIRVLPTTQNANVLLLFRGQLVVEFQPDKIHIVQQIDLMNIGEATYIFPSTGLPFRLPVGATGFQTQPSMNDQRVSQRENAVLVRGSLPPGRSMLAWAYDLPYTEKRFIFSQDNQLRTFSYMIAVENIPGMTIDADGFPPAQRAESDGKKYLVTETQRSPSDPPLHTIRVVVNGLPQQGPYRMIAVILSLLFLGMGIMWLIRSRKTRKLIDQLATRKQKLIDQIRELDQEHIREEIGPEFYEQQRLVKLHELAAVIGTINALDENEPHPTSS